MLEMLEMCKNILPTSGRIELPKSCTTSTMNLHMVYFSWIPQNNARLQLSWKFGESKCNSHWDITLTTSHGTNYVLNEHIHFSQHDPYAIWMILWYSYSASFKNRTETWLIYCINELIWHLLYPWWSWPTWPKCDTILDNAVLQLSCMFDESQSIRECTSPAEALSERKEIHRWAPEGLN